MQQTEKYKFNLPNDFEDRFSTDPLNENMEKVERELAALADADAADKAALLTAIGTGGHNARIAWGTYEGNGKTQTLEFDFKPILVVISRVTKYTVMTRDCQYSQVAGNSSSDYVREIVWNDRGLSFAWEMNESGSVYRYVCIGVSPDAEDSEETE